MNPTWKKIVFTSGKVSPNCKCLICGKEFTFLGDSHFNMKLITCPTCKQQVWVPRCPNDCPSFDNSDSPEHLGSSIKFNDYIPEDVKNEEHH